MNTVANCLHSGFIFSSYIFLLLTFNATSAFAVLGNTSFFGIIDDLPVGACRVQHDNQHVEIDHDKRFFSKFILFCGVYTLYAYEGYIRSKLWDTVLPSKRSYNRYSRTPSKQWSPILEYAASSGGPNSPSPQSAAYTSDTQQSHKRQRPINSINSSTISGVGGDDGDDHEDDDNTPRRQAPFTVVSDAGIRRKQIYSCPLWLGYPEEWEQCAEKCFMSLSGLTSVSSRKIDSFQNRCRY